MNKKIFLVFPANASGTNDSIWTKNLYLPLLDMGFKVYFLDYNKLKNDKNLKTIDDISEKIYSVFIAEHSKERFDYFFYYLNSSHINSGLIGRISEKVFTINYTTNFHQFSNYIEQINSSGINIYVSKIAENEMSKITDKYYWMPFAANPKYYFPREKVAGKSLSFLGSRYGPRPYYLWRILQNNLPIRIYGPKWKIDFRSMILRGLYSFYLNLRSDKRSLDQTYRFLNEQILFNINKYNKNNLFGPLSDDDYLAELSESFAVLNIPESRYDHDFNNPDVLICTNLRDFEVTMSGTLLFTQKSDELDLLFNDGSEVIAYRNEFEMVDKIKYYLSHEDEAIKIAYNGYLRASRDHTWQKRFTDLFNHIQKNFG